MVWFVQEEHGNWYVCAAVPDKVTGLRIAAALQVLGIHGAGAPMGLVPLAGGEGVPVVGTPAPPPPEPVEPALLEPAAWEGGSVRFKVSHCPRAAETKLEGLGFRRGGDGQYEVVVEARGVDEVRRALWKLGRTVTWKMESEGSGL